MNVRKNIGAKHDLKTILKAKSVLIKSCFGPSVCNSMIQIQNNSAYGRLASINRAALEEEMQS